MKSYKELLKELLAKHALNLRSRLRLTQDDMSEKLRISTRAYGDLERGKFCFSAVALLFFLILLNEDELAEFLREFKDKVKSLEKQDAA